jgi:hypothetical protein
MNDQLIKAHLNLYAVLQNLEDVVRLDAGMAELTKRWDVAIQFMVWNGPAAHLEFKNGTCRHGIGAHPHPRIKLFFTSPQHLNRMFDGKATPIPLKGFTRLGFLQKEFSKLTDRLTYYLKPENGLAPDEPYLKINTILTLYTAMYAVRELARLEPVSRTVASRIPAGGFQVEVLPDGPHIHMRFGKDDITVTKGVVDNPMARMTFRNLDVAHELLNNKLDAFLAVAQGDVMLQGQLPIIDNVNLILDRVALYLK